MGSIWAIGLGSIWALFGLYLGYRLGSYLARSATDRSLLSWKPGAARGAERRSVQSTLKSHFWHPEKGWSFWDRKLQFCQLKFVVKAWLKNQEFVFIVFLVWGGARRGTPQAAPYYRGNQRRRAARNAKGRSLLSWTPAGPRHGHDVTTTRRAVLHIPPPWESCNSNISSTNVYDAQ